MAGEKEYAEGIWPKKPTPNAPDFILMNIGLEREELIKWLQTFEDEYVDVTIFEGKTKPYVRLNTYNKEYKRVGADSAPQAQETKGSTGSGSSKAGF